MKLLLLIVLNCWAGGETVPIESLDKPGALQAMQQAFDDKFSIRGGTITGTSLFSSSVTVKGILSAETNASFTGAASTVTFTGWIDIGLVTATPVTADQVADSVCPTGTYVISGECSPQAACGQVGSLKLNSTTWRCQCGAVVSMKSTAYCARIKWN